jgi:20S proteasome alpha/beta subunit
VFADRIWQDRQDNIKRGMISPYRKSGRRIPRVLNRFRNIMTIIVGLICKDGIVLAGDSQTTTGTSKRCDAKKFALVKFTDAEVLVAQAGNASTAGRAIEIFRDSARGQALRD